MLQSTKGVLTLSFDLELAWGSIENQAWGKLERQGVFVRTREVISRLLATMRTLDIPATWAVVGNLWEAPGDYQWDYISGDLRKTLELAAQAAQQASLDGRDLIDQIVKEPTAHRLACHSYAHVRFGHAAVDANFVRRDLSTFCDRRPDLGRWCPTLIFPCNEDGHWDVVRELGFTTCRGTAGAAPRVRGSYRRWAARVHRWTAPPPLSVSRQVAPGLIRSTDSMLYHTGRRRWLLSWLERRALRGLRQAVTCGGTLHVWTHPFNFAETSGLLESFQLVLGEAARLRDAGRLQIVAFGADED